MIGPGMTPPVGNNSLQCPLGWGGGTAIAALGNTAIEALRNTAIATIEKVTAVSNVGTELGTNDKVSGGTECDGYDRKTLVAVGLVGIATGMLVGPYIIKRVSDYCTSVRNQKKDDSKALMLVPVNESGSHKQGQNDDNPYPDHSFPWTHYNTTVPRN